MSKIVNESKNPLKDARRMWNTQYMRHLVTKKEVLIIGA